MQNLIYGSSNRLAVVLGKLYRMPRHRVRVGPTVLDEHRRSAWILFLNRRLRVTGPVSIDLIVVKNGVVASVSKNNHSEGVVRSANSEDRDILLDRARIFSMAHATAVDRYASGPLLER